MSTQAQEWRGEEMLVKVNQRALIDKVLARYSGEFTFFRELLQNADDAGSLNAEIRFETAAYECRAKGEHTLPLPGVADPSHANVVKWTFRNDGKEFDNGDWERLPRIAEGNPNPEKIGAFGVGFYSVFSVTDNPCVSSGEREMEFYWKNDDNQLYTCCHTLPQRDHWTTFKMPLREPGPMLCKLDLMRFLASSITFMVNLTAVGVFFDDDRVGYIKKSSRPPQTIDVPEGMKRSSPESIMHVKEVWSQYIMIDAEMKNAVCASAEAKDSPSMEISKSRVDLTIFIAEVDVVDEKLPGALFRCMKKKPPSRLKYSLIYTGKDAHDRDSVGQRNYQLEVESIFQGLYADLEGAKHTRIFIGHATGQTTSIGGHMASRFIPTVERESIDFVDKYVFVWNKELLYVGGFLCRVVYELELSDIQRLWEAPATRQSDSEQLSKSRDDLHQRFLHVLKFFAFHHSTPSLKVSQILRESFYGCYALPLRLLSLVGVCGAPNIRVFNQQVAKFLNSIPMLSERVSRDAASNIDGLPDPYKISSVTIQDVLQALDQHPLSEEKLTSCLQWWLELKRNDPSLTASELLYAVTFVSPGGTPRPLSHTEYFINTQGLGAHIPRDAPLPVSLIPFNVTTHFTPAELVIFGWRELTIGDWFQHISHADVMLEDPVHDFTKSLDWAGRVLFILSRAWSSFSDKEHCTVKAVFENTPCIPTSHGLRRPNESYLPVANDALFHKFGLPIVDITGPVLDKDMRSLLSFIGAQIHIPLELLLSRMLATEDWSLSDFINYLVRISPTPPQFSMLKSPKLFFSKECSRNDVGEKPRYSADELYPPIEIFHQLQLPVIDWDQSKWSDESNEAELLYHLGLHRYPPLQTIIELCASPSPSVGATAFSYFCDNIRSKYSEYNPKNFHEVAFVPAENKDGTCLKTPGDVFLGAQWKMLGFSVVRNAYVKISVSELGIQQNPPPSKLLYLMETSPPLHDEAPGWFECLSECIQAFTQPELSRLSELKIVPTSSPDSQKWLTPTECYLGPSTNEFYSKLFVFVDFGTKANRFLSACGSMKEPSVKDVAESLIHDPDRFYGLAGSHESFLDKLRDLATRRAYIPNETLHRMSLQRTLLGKRRERANGQEGWKFVYELRTPKDIVIVDDSRDYELFGDTVYVAPQDELLEFFYNSIGCRRLSDVIHEKYETSPAIVDTKICSKVRTLILERLDSFLKKCSHYHYDQARDPRSQNFIVVVCERLLVHKTLIIGNDSTPRRQDLWAVTKCNEDGSIELWLSDHAKEDMYDLAASLCRLLFGTVKDTDTFLLAAMLSADLELLKRAGFDVDQFPEQKSPELLAGMSTKDGVLATDTSHSCAKLPVGQSSHPQSTLGYIRGSIADTVNTARDAYHTVKGSIALNSRPSKYANTPRQVIPQSYIRDIVARATEACSSGSRRLLDDEDKMVQFLRHHSCNDFAQVDNLRSLGITQQGIGIHVAGDAPDVCAFIAGKQELLARFIRIIIPAASAHKLPMKSLHIFYDVGEGPIAFNLDGSIYLSLRYFEEWHDDDVEKGHLRRAQLSWFFALAHEIAHNLIPSHDAAHEFSFSAICEAHIDDFSAAVVSDA